MKIHKVLKNKLYRSWGELETEIARIECTSDKGDAFEQFCYFYFLFHKNLYQVSEVYSPKILGRDIPVELKQRLKLSKNDDGVDGLLMRTDGSLIAYQSKFRSGRISPPSNELNDFWSEAEYADFRMVITNALRLPSDVFKRKNSLSVLVSNFESLTSDFFSFLYEAVGEKILDIQLPSKFIPFPHQDEIIDSVIMAYKSVDRGKVIAACATGKTLISLWISERMSSEIVLFMAPNLALIRQTIEKWTRASVRPIEYMAVCSDTSVVSMDNDEFDLAVGEVDIPVTTDPISIAAFLRRNSGAKKIIFSTYQSTPAIVDAIKMNSKFSGFDLAIFDEAHRTAGANQNSSFSLALDDEKIPCKKRLFLTATERLVKPWIKERLEQADRVVFSMDDEDIYGPTIHKLPFGRAIAENIICDYRIVLAGIDVKEIREQVDSNRYLTSQSLNGEIIPAQTLFKALLLLKTVKETGIKKVVSFHTSIKEANLFTEVFKMFSADFLSSNGVDPNRSGIFHVNGTLSASERSSIFSEFEKSSFGLLTNVRCLTEGVDIPFIDGVLFADAKGSLIDIVQAVGRALRKPINHQSKVSYIIVPLIFDENGESLDLQLEGLHSVIQALRDQDELLGEWIDAVNMSVVRGRTQKSVRLTDKIRVILPQKIDVGKFVEHLEVRISEVNSRPTGVTGLGSKLRKTERISEYKRVFKCIGDYNFDVFEKSLVLPTVGKFKKASDLVERSKLVVNNNNVSHSERLGFIRKVEGNKFCLTEIGKLYVEGKFDFARLFKNQMMLFKLLEGDESLFPYRAAFQIIKEIKSINYIEFLYSIYSLAASKNHGAETSRAIEFVNELRGCFPNIMKASDANKESILEDLNSKHLINFGFKDVWTDRTTPGNQFRYFINHIGLYDDVFLVDKKSKIIRLLEGQESRIDYILRRSNDVLLGAEYSYGCKDSIWNAELEGGK